MSQELEVELNEIRAKFARNLAKLHADYDNMIRTGQKEICVLTTSMYFDFSSMHAFEHWLKETNVPHKLDYNSDYDSNGFDLFRSPSFIFRFS